MRISYFLLTVSLLCAACGGRTLSADHARDLIMRTPGEALQEDDIEVVRVRQVTGTEAIVETRLDTAFRLEKESGRWIVREVRLGHGEWEKVSNLLRTLEEVRIAETRMMIDKVVEAVARYQSARGSLPSFNDYVSLSDVLSPEFLTPLIRLDSWRQPLAAERLNPNSIVIRSAGPDGKHGTPDDISRTFPSRSP